MDTIDHPQNQQWSLQQKDLKFIDQLVSYSMMSAYRETSHTINNLLTSLTIYISMLKNNLNKGKIDKAVNSLDSIENSLNNITDFTGKLSQKINWQLTPETVCPNSVIKESIDLCNLIFKQSESSVLTRFCETNENIKTDTSIIQMLLVSWYAMNLQIFGHPEMIIQTSWDGGRKQFTMSGVVSEKNGNTESKVIPRESSGSCGEIPLMTMKRIIHSNFQFADLKLLSNDHNDFELILTSL
ncbi:MAG: hypothetical protein HQ510_11785 [Candidatus Marinimicrobia bacterium]|nr:hypothetical protein [Candidatus Neomarinimicrobiota bacterium]